MLSRAARAAIPRARQLSSSAAGSSAAQVVSPGDVAVIGACYVGAALWLYRDYLEKPKPPSVEAAQATATAHGVEALAGELGALRQRLEAMDEEARWRAGGCATGPLLVVGTGGGGDSLFTLRMSPDRGSAVAVGAPLKVGANPSFVTKGKAGSGTLYVAHEGAVSAVAVNARAATLAPLGGAQSACGAGTCYVEPDAACAHVLVANYAGGSVAVLPVQADGTLGPATDAKIHGGATAAFKPELADRQEAAHPHSIRPDPWAGEWAFVPDLGMDTLFVYAYDAKRGVLAGAPSAARHFKSREGAGPRHLCFSPVSAPPARRLRACASRASRATPFGRAHAPSLVSPRAAHALRARARSQPSRAEHLVYLLNEMEGSVVVLAHDSASGALAERQTVSLLPHFVKPTRQGHCGSAEIAMHPSGKFLYATNRSAPACAASPFPCARARPRHVASLRALTRPESRAIAVSLVYRPPHLPPRRPPRPPRSQNHSISIFCVDKESGSLLMTANVPCGGKTPRHFAISPSGEYLVVSNQSSNDIATFKIETTSGMLSRPTITPLPQSPRCICIVDESERPLNLN